MPTHTPQERRKRAAAAAAGAVVGPVVGGVARAGSRGAAALRRARPSQRAADAASGAAIGAALGPGQTIRGGASKAARGAMTAKQAGAIQPPHNSPPMSSLGKVGGISGRK